MPLSQDAETTSLILAFPEDFPDAQALEDEYRREGEAQAREDVSGDLYIAANFDECGYRFG